jgi:predicted SprT family Zn-dependent metalloprotease
MDLLDAETLALHLLNEHGLLAQGWRFAWDDARRRFGCCRHSRKMITLSRELTLLNPLAEVHETILHEIAHALLPPGMGHGKAWKRTAAAIGCTGRRCHNAVTPDPEWVGTCPACSAQIRRHRRNERLACAGCCRGMMGRYNPAYRFVWRRAEADYDEE